MTEIEHLREALRNAARNDKTCYEYGEGRACDGKNPGDDGIWLTPREIARTALKEPNLATLSETLAAATEIPMDDCNLSINCGRDGTWLPRDANGILMTEAERITWGIREHHLRLADIASVKAGHMELADAQANARCRVKQSGMTELSAHNALVDAQRKMRSL